MQGVYTRPFLSSEGLGTQTRYTKPMIQSPMLGRPLPERDLLALPARLGGLGIIDPSKKSGLHYSASKIITAPLVRLIIDQSEAYAPEVKAAQTRMKNNARKFHRQFEVRTANDLKENLPTKLQKI
jgi:hypothetical protein